MPAPITTTFFCNAMPDDTGYGGHGQLLDMMMIPKRDVIRICFAHAAYQMKPGFDAMGTGISSFAVTSRDELDSRIGEADVLLASGLWHNGLIANASRLKFIQSISSGTDQYDKAALAAKGIRLASAAGVNARAVAEHAMALILAMARRLPEARDNQALHHWRGMIGNLSQREDELGGKTMLIIGLGRIGSRLAQLGRAFDMTVIGFRRDPSAGQGAANVVHTLDHLHEFLPQADFVVLTCPLTPETKEVIDARALALMPASSFLINTARGGCVATAALIAALTEGKIAGAALDCTDPEPPEQTSPLWDMPNVFLTPHTGGETREYETNVLTILMANLERLWRGEAELMNQIV
jgi:phosphoglycerate dehydrogenase-like enzyme